MIYLLILIFGFFGNRVIFDFINHMSRSPSDVRMLLSDQLWVKFFIGACVIAPITEEWIFRKLLLGHFKKHGMGIVSSLFLSSMMFSIFHFNIVQSLLVFLPGMFMGYLYWKSDSILPSITMHAIYNFSGMCAIFDAEFFKFSDITEVLFSNPMVTIMVAVASFCGIVGRLEKRVDM